MANSSVLSLQDDLVSDAIAVRLSRTEIAIELVASGLANLMTTWEVRDAATGEVKCSMDTRMKSLGCVDVNAVRGRNNYAIYGIWWGGSLGPYSYSLDGLQNDRTFTFYLIVWKTFG